MLSQPVLRLSVPCHLPLLLFEAVLLVEWRLVLGAVEGDLVAAVKDSNVLDRLDQAEPETLPPVAAVHCHVLDMPALQEE